MSLVKKGYFLEKDFSIICMPKSRLLDIGLFPEPEPKRYLVLGSTHFGI